VEVCPLIACSSPPRWPAAKVGGAPLSVIKRCVEALKDR
jgi:hypothetical protein